MVSSRRVTERGETRDESEDESFPSQNWNDYSRGATHHYFLVAHSFASAWAQ